MTVQQCNTSRHERVVHDMQVQLSQNTAIQIRDATAQRNEVTQLQTQNEKLTTELKELQYEKQNWDEKLNYVMEQAGRDKAAANARIAKLEQDMRKLLHNVQSSSASLKSIGQRAASSASKLMRILNSVCTRWGYAVAALVADAGAVGSHVWSWVCHSLSAGSAGFGGRLVI